MKFLRITTPTELDLREIIVLGLTTKANSEKIGHKGSGLKFTLAYLHRLGSYLTARSPKYHLRSETRTATIKGIEHQLIHLCSLDSERVWDANITTHAGADTWTEPWFILREILQNAIDENGTYEITEEADLPETAGSTSQILLTPELERAWEQREIWFQPRYPDVLGKGHPEVKGLYFHGFLIYNAGENWEYSYDVTDVLRRDQLSEDRQLRNSDLDSVFRRIVEVAGFDAMDPDIYRHAFNPGAKDDIGLLYNAVYYAIRSDRTSWGGERGFKLSKLVDAFYGLHGKCAAFHVHQVQDNDPQAYYARAAGFTPVHVPHRVGTILQGYSPVKQLRDCLPGIQQRLRKVKSVEISRFAKLKAAMRIAKRIQTPGVRVEVVTQIVETDNIHCEALADPANNRIMVLERLLDRDIPEITRALIEEYIHLKSGAGDMSREMQDALIAIIYDLLTRHRRPSVANLHTSEPAQNVNAASAGEFP